MTDSATSERTRSAKAKGKATVGRLFPENRNRLIRGDCLEVLPTLPAACIDLVYIDPPFFTGREHVGTSATEQVPSFSDTWEGGLSQYVAWLKARIAAVYRVLAKTGTIYIHIDWRTSHYVKCVCDEIFGYQNFRNEIYWRRDIAGKGAKRISRQWPRNADNILVYSKSESWYFDQAYDALTPKQAKNYRYEDSNGRKFKAVQLGDYSEASISRMESEGLIYVSKMGKKYKKYFLDEARSTVDAMWTDIFGFGTRTASKERLGYPTQKPEALLERIITASSKEGDVVADFFCGSGTTCAVAQRLGRSWIGVDCSSDAVEMTRARMERLLAEMDDGAGRPPDGSTQAELFSSSASDGQAPPQAPRAFLVEGLM